MKKYKKRTIDKNCPVCLTRGTLIWDSEHNLWKCSNCGRLYVIVMREASKPLKEMEIPE